MNTTEAIEFLEAENIIRLRSAIDIELLTENYKRVILFLKQGEAYKTIFKKITTNGYFSSIDTRYLLELEQKYFPKGEIK